jgi:hypothetical protein
MAARPHTDLIASCRLTVCGARRVSRQALLLWTYWRTGVSVVTTALQICSSGNAIYSRNVEHMRDKRNAYERFAFKSEEKTPRGQLRRS